MAFFAVFLAGFLAVVLGFALPAVVSAQEWAEKMFDARRHDFGTVAVLGVETGIYNIPTVQGGTYSIKVSKDGFRTIVQDNIEIAVNYLEFCLSVHQRPVRIP